MPLLRLDLIEGRTDAELDALLDAVHRAMLEAFRVPERDRYQIVHEHKPGRMRILDTGLGIERSDKLMVLQVTTRRRSEDQKQAFYRLLCAELAKSCGMSPADVMVSIVENGDADWSFGHGEAQYLTGRLGLNNSAGTRPK
jgi:phenylpyruvate tautomerase PptA (4-oxalocrotonate tautomerase family)